ncbi:MAG: HlyD family type I secretion periplasmic adaptor subunit, partial [Lentisphaeria bacterium]|nr:HlyD family type I secretion periplasmic adaptor subunit [Lentisphaeria bacterium]
NEKLPLWIRYSVLYSSLFMAAALIWACICKVDVVVQAPGKLVTDDSSIVMKPLERTVIQKIHVKIGQIVKKDQVLITFDPTMNRAEAERLVKELSILTAQYNRLLAEFENRIYKPDSGEAGQRQLAIFRQRAEFFRERSNYFDEGIKQLDASRKAREDTLQNQRARLAAIKQIESMFKKLHESRAGSLKELLSVNISRMEMEAAIDEQQNHLLELRHQRESTLSSKQSFVQEWRNNISEELVKVERELTSTQKSYDKVKQLIEYVELRAPCDSVVHEIAAFSVGSAVREAEALITLIPLGGTIELEAEVQPQDIGRIQVGSDVRIKLNAYPFQKHGTLDGKVRNISENTLQKQSQVPLSYYRARIVVSGRLKHTKKDFRLIPGMEAQAEIKVGRRRIIEFLIYPLIRALDETAREP